MRMRSERRHPRCLCAAGRFHGLQIANDVYAANISQGSNRKILDCRADSSTLEEVFSSIVCEVPFGLSLIWFHGGPVIANTCTYLLLAQKILYSEQDFSSPYISWVRSVTLSVSMQLRKLPLAQSSTASHVGFIRASEK